MGWGLLRARAGWVGLVSAAALLVISGLGAPGGVFARSHAEAVPKAKLKSSGGSQRGALWSSEWSSPAGSDSCVVQVVQGLARPEQSLEISARPRTPRLVLPTVERPRRVVIRDHRRVDADGLLTGESRRVFSSLLPKRRGGELVGWRVRFRVRGAREHYLDVRVRWPDHPDCGRRQASWVFHLDAR